MELSLHEAYAELGLAPGATEGEVKSAWRRLVSQWHPDRNASTAAVTKMQRVNQAFKTLRSSGYGHADEAHAEAQPGRRHTHRAPPHKPAPAPDAPREAQADPPAPDEPAGAAGAEAGLRGGRAVSRKLKLSLEEAAFGCTKVLQGQVTEACSACAGLGHRVLGGPCAACDGAGRVRQRNWYGLFGAELDCEACAATGDARQGCAACAGAGKLAPRKYRVTVRIPAGVRDGDMLQVDARRLRAGQPAGGLQLRVEVAAHPLFRLEPDGSVHCEVPVDAFLWLGQGVIEVPTLEGHLQSLSLYRNQLDYRLTGLGFPVERRGPRGDQFISLRPSFPERLGSDQQILLDQLVAAAAGAKGASSSSPRLREWEQQLRVWSRGRRKP